MANNSREKLGGHGVHSEEGAQTVAEKQTEVPEQPKAERYQVEFVPLAAGMAAGTDASSLAKLQGALNKGARQRWRLVGMADDPTSQGILVVWDTASAISS